MLEKLFKNTGDFEVMIIDDNENNINVLSSMLKNEYKIRIAKNGRMAWKSISLKKPNLILLDINMPEMDGYELARLIRKDISFNSVPIIFVSAMSDISDKLKCFELGAVDYITKPFLMEEVKARVSVHLKNSELQKLILDKNKYLNHKVVEKT